MPPECKQKVQLSVIPPFRTYSWVAGVLSRNAQGHVPTVRASRDSGETGLSSGRLGGELDVAGQRTECRADGGRTRPAAGRRGHVTQNTAGRAGTGKEVPSAETPSPREEGETVGSLQVTGDLEFQAEGFRHLLQVAESPKGCAAAG